MKVKIAKEVELTANEQYEIILNENAKAGDTIAREFVFICSTGVTIENGDNYQKVINAATLDVEEYQGGWAIIPCEGLNILQFTSETNATLWYKILV